MLFKDVMWVTISLSEAVFGWDGGTPHRSLRSLCVALTINQKVCHNARIERITLSQIAVAGVILIKKAF